MELEGGFIRTPFECFHRVFRLSQKTLMREMGSIESTLDDISTKRPNLSPQELNNELDSILNRLQLFREDVCSWDQEEVRYLEVILERIAHLKAIPESVSNPLMKSSCKGNDPSEWETVRLDRWVSEYMLQSGYHQSAAAFVEQRGIKNFVDIEVYAEIDAIRRSLLEEHSCELALGWCAANGSRLRRVGSPFEYLLHIQKFLQLILAGEQNSALAYGTNHLKSLPQEEKYYKKEVIEYCREKQNSAMNCIIYANNILAAPKECRKFACNPNCWDDLCIELNRAAVQAYGLACPAILYATVRCGMCVLKTSFCVAESRNESSYVCPANPINECPNCSVEGQILCKNLPFAHHGHSVFRCRISGEIMDASNPPLALPNGQVYSKKALEHMAAKCENGTVTCPMTNSIFSLKRARNVFII